MAASQGKEILQSVPSGVESVFPKEEYDRRLADLRKLMAEIEIDLLLVTGPENIFYLTGQQTPGYYMFQCLSVPIEGPPFHVIRNLEVLNCRVNTYLSDIVGYADDASPGEVLAEALRKRGWFGKRVAADRKSWFLTIDLFDRIRKSLGELTDGSGLVEKLRAVKSPLELDQIKKAAGICDAGHRAGIGVIKIGATENDVAAAVMAGMISAGSEYLGMEPLISAGPRSGIPHATWRRRKIEEGDMVIIEPGACYNRYHVARFQAVAVGKLPDLAYDMQNICEDALRAALDQMKPGNSCSKPHEACQQVIDEAGYTDGFRKRAGYSCGISFAPDWGEGNILSLYFGVTEALQPGMVFHVPITLREYGKFTTAVSETVVITESGHEVLSQLSRGLIQL
jgi:Xaa-Pro dipeptidase